MVIFTHQSREKQAIGTDTKVKNSLIENALVGGRGIEEDAVQYQREQHDERQAESPSNH